jgi:toxin ParE1/3/4
VAVARRPVVVSLRAQRDVDELAAGYADDAGSEIARSFVDALAEAFDLIAPNPGIGSPRYGLMLNLPGVRCWPLRPWSQVIFYVEREHAIDVVRVLHDARDIPATLAEPEDR